MGALIGAGALKGANTVLLVSLYSHYMYLARFQFTDSLVLAVCSDSGGSVFELEFK